MEMKKERVLNAILHKETDKIPHNIELTSEKQKAFCAEIGIDTSEFFDYAGNHIQKADYNSGEYIREGFFRDDFGVVWNRTGTDKDIGMPESDLVNEDNFKDFKFPAADVDRIRTLTQGLVSNGKDTFKFGKISMTDRKSTRLNSSH